MMKKIKYYIKQVTPPIFIQIMRRIAGDRKSTVKDKIIPNLKRVGSFSQQAEDLIIDQLLANKSNGFYVDVGAYDPDQFSNTKRFYLRGWNGINIEPQPDRHKRFILERERDINLNLGIYSRESKMTFYQLEIETLSTFDLLQAKENAKRFHCKIVNTYGVNVLPLKSILGTYLKPNQQIDFISIDTEGNEMHVLNGNDWLLFRPTLILIEFGNEENEIDTFLRKVKYELVYSNNTNGLYLNLGDAS